jgi:hypothetical protein
VFFCRLGIDFEKKKQMTSETIIIETILSKVNLMSSCKNPPRGGLAPQILAGKKKVIK